MPKVIVTFYENFHYEAVDISEVQLGVTGNGTEPRTGERIGGTNPGTFPMTAFYSYFLVKVIASGGTYRLKIHLAGSDYESADIPYNANAAAVNSAFSPPPGGGDPGTPKFEVCGEEGGGESVYCVVPGGWIKVVDIGPSEYEIRFYEESATHIPAGVSVQALAVSLGPVIEMQPRHDEVKYTVELEEGCVGFQPPEGKTEVGGVRHGVHGNVKPVIGRHS